MRFNDLDILNTENKKIFIQGFENTLNKNNFIFGNEVLMLERKLSKMTKNKYCVTVGSGTDALYLSLLSIKIKKNDQILIPSFSWLSVLEVVLMLGAKPVFIKTNRQTFNIDEVDILKKINKNTKAIISTSLFGRSSNLNFIKSLCKRKKIYHIEDAAQNFGSKINNTDACSIADITCTSFFPSKNLGCFGDGGAIFTNKKKIYSLIKILRNHGQITYSNSKDIGINSRLGSIQAAIILNKLKFFKKQIRLQRLTYKKLQKFFFEKNIVGFPTVMTKDQNSYCLFNILVKNRKKLIKLLNRDKIPYKIYYSRPLYKQYRIVNKFKCKVTEQICNQIISLPFNYLSKSRFKTTTEKLSKIIKKNRSIFFEKK